MCCLCRHTDFSKKYQLIDHILTGHENPEKTSLNLDFKEYAKSNATLCIYMGIGQLKRIVGELLEGGLNKDTPVAIIENGPMLSKGVVSVHSAKS